MTCSVLRLDLQLRSRASAAAPPHCGEGPRLGSVNATEDPTVTLNMSCLEGLLIGEPCGANREGSCEFYLWGGGGKNEVICTFFVNIL